MCRKRLGWDFFPSSSKKFMTQTIRRKNNSPSSLPNFYPTCLYTEHVRVSTAWAAVSIPQPRLPKRCLFLGTSKVVTTIQATNDHRSPPNSPHLAFMVDFLPPTPPPPEISHVQPKVMEVDGSDDVPFRFGVIFRLFSCSFSGEVLVSMVQDSWKGEKEPAKKSRKNTQGQAVGYPMVN